MGSGGLAEALGSGACSLWGILGQAGHQASSAQDSLIISGEKYASVAKLLLLALPTSLVKQLTSFLVTPLLVKLYS